MLFIIMVYLIVGSTCTIEWGGRVEARVGPWGSYKETWCLLACLLGKSGCRKKENNDNLGFKV
jgi:hypothetical protein